jgi:hypothetical protein
MGQADFWNDTGKAQATVAQLKTLNTLLKPLEESLAVGRDLEALEELAREDISLEGERAGEDPKVFTHVKLVYRITGHKLKPANVERAVTLSAEKYCSASAMFGKTAAIEHSFEIIEAGEAISG